MSSKKSLVERVLAREVLDSRGNPTVEVEIGLLDGAQGRAIVPSGASTGSYEAVELRDGDISRYGGKGVLEAVANIQNKITPAIRGCDASNQVEIDRILIDLDGTTNKSGLGANALLGVSLATAWAAANSENIPLYRYLNDQSTYVLPTPMCNLLNGGAHATNSTDFQEFMLVPVGASSFHQGIQWIAEIYQIIKHILSERNLATTVGDEGGFAPSLESNQAAMDLLIEAILRAGKKPERDISIALDPAATEIFSPEETYKLSRESKTLSGAEMVDLWAEWKSLYPIISIEDGLAEDDWSSWVRLTERLGTDTQLVGDDLFVTNQKRLMRGINLRAGNAILIKPNQIGTLTETLGTIKMAQQNGFNTVLSHRSGETEDHTIVHLAIATSSGQIKTGAPARGERTAKYNEILRIEDTLGKNAVYLGGEPFQIKKRG
ncbi:MAG: phosphopyruvate hydratase [Chloroflexota bacterium]|nr:phosphopyruvate hydratase [Chloroflexota bacterium]